jgi:menaquinone-dependent protoporphyrinogen oxidase
MSVLVGYISRYGSTRSIAERLARYLGERGTPAEARPLDEVGDPARYEAAVIGSAVYGQHWDPEARHWVERNEQALARLPLWLFSVGMAAGVRGPLRLLVRNERPKEVAGFQQRLHARGHRLFGGVMRRDQGSALGTAVLYAMGGRYGDFRDWSDVDRWAEEISAQLSRDRAARG